MAKKFIEGDTLTAIADAIRAKSGATTKMNTDGMVTRIGSLSIPSGSVTVTTDGTYDVTDYRRAIVNTGASGSRFSYGWNDSTGRLTIQDDDNPLPDSAGEDVEEEDS